VSLVVAETAVQSGGSSGSFGTSTSVGGCVVTGGTGSGFGRSGFGFGGTGSDLCCSALSLDAERRRRLHPKAVASPWRFPFGGDRPLLSATYAPDVKIHRDLETVQLSGREALTKHYRQMFTENPDVHCEIRNRITLGKYVVDHERIRRGGQQIEAIVVYEVEGETIRRVWLIRD